jgi:chemotaxis protein MotA
MVLEGITLLSQHRSPAYVRATLESFAADYQDEINQGRKPAITKTEA